MFSLFNNPRRFLSFTAASFFVWGLGWMMMPSDPMTSSRLGFGPFKVEVIDSTISSYDAEYTVRVTNISEMAVTFANMNMRVFDRTKNMLSIDQVSIVKMGEMMKPGEEKIVSFYVFDAAPSEIGYYTFGPSGLELAEKID